jgi:hypothetical protein
MANKMSTSKGVGRRELGLSRNLAKETEKNYEKPESGLPGI